jgi:Zn-dependent protease
MLEEKGTEEKDTTEIVSQAETEQVWPPKPKIATKPASLQKTLISMLIFTGLFLILGLELRFVLILVLVLLFHELGHFVAMQFFGFTNLNIFFLPFFGALATGSKEKFEEREEALTILAGPVPGIVLGILLLVIQKTFSIPRLQGVPETFLALNMLNLLPVPPLDGGRLAETLFVRGHIIIEWIFLSLALVALLSFAWAFQTFSPLFLAFFLLMRIRSSLNINKMRKKLRKMSIDYNKNYVDLTDEEYYHLSNGISRAVKQELPKGLIFSWIMTVLQPVSLKPLTFIEKTGILLLWIASFLVPIMIYSYYFRQEIMDAQPSLFTLVNQIQLNFS